jgi:dihydroneopterin aldolase
MGLIQLEGMEFFAYHGCFKEERVIGTRFTVDAWLTVPTSEAEISDSLADTLNYQTVYALIRKEMEIHSHLLEHVAARIIKTLTDEFPEINHIKVKISKLNPSLAHGGNIKKVSVTLEQ